MEKDVSKSPEEEAKIEFVSPEKTIKVKRTKIDNAQKKMKKKLGVINDTATVRFFNDVKDGDLDQFDVTTFSGFSKELLMRIKKVDVSGLGSQLAFFFLLSFFPLLIFIFTLLPYLNLNQAEVFLFIRDYAPESVALLIEDTVGEILNNRNGGLLSIGVIGTIWSASKGMNALTKALNLSYFKEETRSFIVARGMSMVFTVMLIAVLLLALVLPVFGQQIGTLAYTYLGFGENFLRLFNSLRWIIPPILIYAVFSLTYWLVPNLKIRFKGVFFGASFATIGWIITSLGFSYYVTSYGNYSSTYGSIGAIIALMMWLYFSAIILMLGGQINAVMADRREAILAKEKSNAVN